MLMRFNRYFIIIFTIVSLATLPLTSFAAETHHKASKKAHKHTVATAKKSAHGTKKKAGKKKGPVEAAIPSTVSIQDGIDQIISKFHRFKVGVIVENVDSGAVLYQYNSADTFKTASTLKLFTAAAALNYLGPNFVFKTQILTDGNNAQNGVLPGNLYIKFTGDPELTIPNLEWLIISLAHQGIHHINGHLIVDDTATDHVNMAPGWMMKEELACYAAPSNAVILNRNCFGIGMIPAKQHGSPVQINIVPNLVNLSVINQAVSKSPNSTDCPPLELKSGATNNTYILKGCIAPKRSALSAGVALNDTRAAGANVVVNLLQKHGISVAGNTLFGKTPTNARVLEEHDSKPLSDLVTKMLKKSDNLIAGILFKTVGGSYYHTTGTWENGAQAVNALLSAKAGIDFNKIGIYDGSGLSRFNQVSPIAFGKLLRYAYHMPYNEIFYKALPSSGIDGTLRGRLGGATAGKVHAKTGTIDATSGLAGYVETRNHGRLIFVVLVNDSVDGKGSQGTYHALQDRIVQFLAFHQPVSAKPNTPSATPATVVPVNAQTKEAATAATAKTQTPVAKPAAPATPTTKSG